MCPLFPSNGFLVPRRRVPSCLTQARQFPRAAPPLPALSVVVPPLPLLVPQSVPFFPSGWCFVYPRAARPCSPPGVGRSQLKTLGESTKFYGVAAARGTNSTAFPLHNQTTRVVPSIRMRT